ncbi:MAG: hypothetical protein GEV12_10155 [Micromonosporaceae bacterium]|nr:hypothetical protein [Micromonosporaceae bacterium]
MRPWTAGLAVVVTAALLLAGCGRSNVPDDVDVTVAGTVRLPDGSPAAGVPVGLLKEPSGLSILFEFAVTVASIGTLCLTRSVSICQGARTTTADDGGRFSFTVPGEDTKTFFGNPGSFVVAAELPAGQGQAAGPGVQTRFEIDQVELTVPEVSFWEPAALAVATGPQWVDYSGAERDQHGRPEFTVVVTEGDDVVWSEPAGPEGRLDARSVADLRGAVHVTAVEQREQDGVRFTTSYSTQRLAVQGAAGPPLSRGASCTVDGPEPTVFDPCPVTDGRYADELPHQSCPAPSPTPGPDASPPPCTANTWVSVDLGTPRPIGAVFVHGLSVSSDVAVETSGDGVTWTTVTTGELASYDRVELPDRPLARHLRLRTADPSHTLAGLAELSVWP